MRLNGKAEKKYCFVVECEMIKEKGEQNKHDSEMVSLGSLRCVNFIGDVSAVEIWAGRRKLNCYIFNSNFFPFPFFSFS